MTTHVSKIREVGMMNMVTQHQYIKVTYTKNIKLTYKNMRILNNS